MLTGNTYLNTSDRGCYRVVYEDQFEIVLFAMDESKESCNFLVEKPAVFKEYVEERAYVKCGDPTDYVNTNHMTDEARETMNLRYEMATEIYNYNDHAFFEKSERPAVIRHFKRKFGKSRKTLYRMMNSFFRGNMCPVAMAPKTTNNGNPGQQKKNLKKPGPPGRYPGSSTWANRDKFSDIYQNVYLTAQKKSIQEAYNTLLKLHFTDSNGYLAPDAPSYNQFRRFVKKQDLFKAEEARNGKRAAEQNKRVLHSTEDADVTGPYQVVQIDATPLSVNCVSTFNPSVIVGRPHAYLAIDVYSRMVLGYALTFENNGYLSLVECIVNIVEDKNEACLRDGFEIPSGAWDVKGVMPREIEADRGESWTKNADNITLIYGTEVENKKSYRGDLKGIVERLIGSVEAYVKTNFPGAIIKDHPDRGDRDNSKDACLTISDVRKVLVEKIIEHNNTCISKFPLSEEQLLEQEIPVPRLLFENGLPLAQGLRHGVNPEQLRWDILKEKELTVRKDKTVWLNDLRYSSTDPNVQAALQRLQGEKVRVMYSERDTNHVRVVHEKSRADFILDIFPKQRTDLSRSERTVLKEGISRKREEYNRTEGHKAMVESMEKTEAVIEEAKSRHGDKPNTKPSRENRELEKKRLRRAAVDLTQKKMDKKATGKPGFNPRAWRESA